MATFTARARALDMLGRQQIAGLPTAINELFKNAHDAYADAVVVDYYRQSGLFVLRDDGTGMTEADFVGRWMTLGTESKLGAPGGIALPQPHPTKPIRSVLGEKGIGRLSIAVIGPQVLVLTRARHPDGSDDLVVAFIHWGLFELPGLNLNDIEVPVRRFPGGTLPNGKDIQALVDAVRANVATLLPRIGDARCAEINALLQQFTIDPQSMAPALGKPSLLGDEYGTQFYILPTDESLEANIDLRSEDAASPLVKGLIGFTNTMIPGHAKPSIIASFRDHPDSASYTDLIAEHSFFTPDEFEEADHHIRGVFDSYGQFRGTVTVYGASNEYVVPWAAGGHPTECGPFHLTLAYVQGTSAQTKLPPDRFNFLTRKLNLLGGLYIYKDGVRVLPYGDNDYDFIDIEKNRTKSASYYYFSYRRLFGVIEIASTTNGELREKAGREGFRQNRAYRQFRGILKNFFVQVAADFFREHGAYAEQFITTRNDLDQMDRTRKRREMEAGPKRRAFGRALDETLVAMQSGKPEQEVLASREAALRSLTAAAAIEDEARAAGAFVDAELMARRTLEDLRDTYRVTKPRGVGLSKHLRREWEAYLQEDARLQTTLFEPALRELTQLATDTAREMRVAVDRRRRMERGLRDAIERARKSIAAQSNQVRTAVEEARTRVLALMRESGIAMERATNEAQSRLATLDTASQDDEGTEISYQEVESLVAAALAREQTVLSDLHDQLEHLTWSEDGPGRVIDTVATTEALEEEVLGLREQAGVDADLVQLGMAAAIINHEYDTAIHVVRTALRRLKPWADANERLGTIYRDLLLGFDQLDSYLRLLTPLQRSLYRGPVTFSGAAVEQYLRALFRGHLEREGATLQATPAFRQANMRGNPATLYAVFVNLIDNALFWLRPAPAPRIVRLDAEGGSLMVMDTGRGIPSRDREAIFEAGFSRKPGGRGLGLFIARESLRKEGYRLVLDPPSSAGGATFRIERALQG